jgi:hypothetical protein
MFGALLYDKVYSLSPSDISQNLITEETMLTKKERRNKHLGYKLP